MNRHRIRWITLVVFVVMVMAGCGDSDSTPTSTSLPLSTSTTDAGPGGDFPVVIPASNGEITIDARPERVVSMSATHTEMLYAIGAASQIAATDLTSNFPAEANDTPKVDSFNFNVEEVAALDPDLVILAFDFAGEVAALETAGIPTLLFPPPPTVDGALDQLRLLGQAVGEAERAAELAATMEADIAEAVAAAPALDVTPDIFYEVDNTLYSANSETLVGDLFTRFGLVNIADAAPDEAGAGFPQLSEEFVVDADPDIIFLGDASFGESAETVAARPGWDQITAVQEGNIVELDGDIAGRWGPRTVDLARQIGAALAELGG